MGGSGFWEVFDALEGIDDLEDPRRGQGRRHRLVDILVIALCGAIGGADSWVEIALFGRAKESWFRQFLELPHGIPTHDTFGRVFAQLDPEALERCLARWIGASGIVSQDDVVAIDGKTLRRSHDRRSGKKALHLVCAWAVESRIVLGQRAVDVKSNEITAIPELLKLFDVNGKIVTIDAMGTQERIAAQIVEAGGDYVLAVKDNQPTLHAEVRYLLSRVDHPDYPKLLHDEHRCVGKDHGRLEKRHVQVITDPQRLHSLDPQGRWSGLRSIVAVHSSRVIDGNSSVETRYFISSLDGNAKRIAHAIRAHWDIENGLHWTLDVVFREDESRVRTGHSPQNFAALRRLALGILKRDTSNKTSLKGRRLRAGWDHDYLRHLLVSL